MNEWQQVRLGDVIFVNPDSLTRDYPFKDIIYVDISSVGSGTIQEELTCLSISDAPSRAKRLIKDGDTIISTVRPNRRSFLYVKNAPENIVVSTGFAVLRASNNIDSRFLYYIVTNRSFTDYLVANAQGSAYPAVNTDVFENALVSLPPLPEQRAIAEILGSLDDKIEANRRENETLEATARAIFKSWFVDFDPVHAKARGEQPVGMDAETAALFPDSFEDSALGLIPCGWRVGTLGDIAENPRRGIQPENMPLDTYYVGLEHMPRQSIALQEWGFVDDVNSNKYSFKENEILFGKLRPYFHKVVFAPLDGICSTDILAIAPYERLFYGLLLMYLSSEAVIEYATRVSTGTRMPRTNWDSLSQYPIILPDHEIIKIYNEAFFSIQERIKNNIFESRTMAETRDALLPRLVSGELRVGHVEGYKS